MIGLIFLLHQNEKHPNSFARGCFHTMCDGGSVLLETNAPPRAIIGFINSWRNEDEAIVDRRYLDGIRVLARYPQKSLIDKGDFKEP